MEPLGRVNALGFIEVLQRSKPHIQGGEVQLGIPQQTRTGLQDVGGSGVNPKP